MMNTSWKTNTAGIAAIVVGIANLLIEGLQQGAITTESASVAVTAVIAGIGLINAKDGNVSNSPVPLATAQAVETAPVHAEAQGSAAVIPNPSAPTVPPQESHKF